MAQIDNMDLLASPKSKGVESWFLRLQLESRPCIARLVVFSETNKIGAILGGHIEMTREPGKYYPIGMTCQPDEAPLALSLEDLLSLHAGS